MTPLDMLRNGGPAAYAAAFFGALGVVVGIVAIIALFFSRRTARVLGVVALVIASFSASVGVIGMQVARRKIDAMLVEQSSTLPPALAERIRVEGFLEAQCAAKIGLVSALGPLVLGGIAAAAGALSTRKWALTIIAAILAGVPTAGALLASQADAHPRYPFDPLQPAPWDLEYARARVDVNLVDGCDDLHDALDESREASLDPASIVPDWREAATRCAKGIFVEIKKANGEWRRPTAPGSLKEPRVWTARTLLDSPLLVDDELRREVAAYDRTTFL
jgi:hypothetical protein